VGQLLKANHVFKNLLPSKRTLTNASHQRWGDTSKQFFNPDKFQPWKVLASLKEIGCPEPIQKVVEEQDGQEAAKKAKKKKGLGKKKKKAVKLGKLGNSEEIGEYKAGG